MTTFTFQRGLYADDPVALVADDRRYKNTLALPEDFGDKNCRRHDIRFTGGDDTNFPAYFVDSDLVWRLARFAYDNGLVVSNGQELANALVRELAETMERFGF